MNKKDHAAGCVAAALLIIMALGFVAVCAVLVRVIIWAVVG